MFTGSTEVGTRVMQTAATNITRVSLELAASRRTSCSPTPT